MTHMQRLIEYRLSNKDVNGLINQLEKRTLSTEQQEITSTLAEAFESLNRIDLIFSKIGSNENK